MVIKVKYIDEKDEYRELYNMSREELIEIIKTDDKIIEKLSKKIKENK